MATSLTTTGVNIGGKYTTAKAWAYFTHVTDTLRDDYGVSSITFESNSIAKINFDTAMSNAYYAAIFAGDGGSSVHVRQYVTNERVTTFLRIHGRRTDLGSPMNSMVDHSHDWVSCVIFDSE
jgi:hypothetical protein